jgi:hypothetical protein
MRQGARDGRRRPRPEGDRVMKKGILFLILASLTFAGFSTGCKSEAKVDDDGAKLEIDKK